MLSTEKGVRDKNSCAGVVEVMVIFVPELASPVDCQILQNRFFYGRGTVVKGANWRDGLSMDHGYFQSNS